MRRAPLRIAPAAILAFMLACAPVGPDNSSAEAFVRDFVNALAGNQVKRFPLFYLQPGDFRNERPVDAQARERFMGTVRAEFLSRCESAADYLSSAQSVIVEQVILREIRPRAVRFLDNVTASYSMVDVVCRADDETVRLELTELIRVGDEWRIPGFNIIIDHGTRDGGEITIELDPPAEESDGGDGDSDSGDESGQE